MVIISDHIAQSAVIFRVGYKVRHPIIQAGNDCTGSSAVARGAVAVAVSETPAAAAAPPPPLPPTLPPPPRLGRRLGAPLTPATTAAASHATVARPSLRRRPHSKQLLCDCNVCQARHQSVPHRAVSDRRQRAEAHSSRVDDNCAATGGQ